jgi:hypothetical protein
VLTPREGGVRAESGDGWSCALSTQPTKDELDRCLGQTHRRITTVELASGSGVKYTSVIAVLDAVEALGIEHVLVEDAPSEAAAEGEEASGRKGGKPPPGTNDGLTPTQLTPVVSAHREELRSCYDEAMDAEGPADVTMTVRLRIQPDGSVSRVDVSQTGAGAPRRLVKRMTTCVRSNVRNWRFPEAGSTTKTQFPLVFRPG